MTKSELAAAIAKDAGISKATAAKVLDAFTQNVTKALKKGQKVTLVGFGTFTAEKRKARKGVNPRTGETIKIKARKVPKFRASGNLKVAVAGRSRKK